jgi:putative oxidoreductase
MTTAACPVSIRRERTQEVAVSERAEQEIREGAVSAGRVPGERATSTPRSGDVTGRSTPQPGRGGSVRAHRVTWALQVVLAVFLVAVAVPKLAGADRATETFDDIGWGQWVRVAIGLAEIAGAVGLVIPRLAAISAVALSALMVGATATNIFILEDGPATVTTVLLFSAFCFIARTRRAALGPPTV